MPPVAVIAPIDEPKQFPFALLPDTVGGLGSGVIVIVKLSLTEPHGPDGSSLLKYSFTVPAVISPSDGLYTTVNELALSKLPLPAVVQLVLEALPPLLPVKLAVFPWQIVTSLPASTVAAGSIVTITESTAEEQPPEATIVFFTV